MQMQLPEAQVAQESYMKRNFGRLGAVSLGRHLVGFRLGLVAQRFKLSTRVISDNACPAGLAANSHLPDDPREVLPSHIQSTRFGPPRIQKLLAQRWHCRRVALCCPLRA